MTALTAADIANLNDMTIEAVMDHATLDATMQARIDALRASPFFDQLCGGDRSDEEIALSLTASDLADKRERERAEIEAETRSLDEVVRDAMEQLP